LPRAPARLDLSVRSADADLPLGRFVAERGGVPLAVARAAIERGGAFVRGKRIRDPLAKVRAGDRVEVDLRPPPAPALPALLHLDEDLLAVDKPAGVLAQEGRGGGLALPDLCAQLLRERGEPDTALLVHRLDRGTTGVTVLARNGAAQRDLAEQFREGLVHKEYRALCAGQPQAEEGLVDLSLGADPGRRGRKHDPRGEPARTRYRVLERFRAAALVAAFPETGRTHQVRVHLASLGLPLAGDARYGGPRAFTSAGGRRLEIARPLLHALALRLRHPRGGEITLRATEPADLLEALAFLRSGGD
jgi:23S rRNA pseudouridine1911/1915/1917 synthase